MYLLEVEKTCNISHLPNIPSKIPTAVLLNFHSTEPTKHIDENNWRCNLIRVNQFIDKLEHVPYYLHVLLLVIEIHLEIKSCLCAS